MPTYLGIIFELHLGELHTFTGRERESEPESEVYNFNQNGKCQPSQPMRGRPEGLRLNLLSLLSVLDIRGN